MAGFIVESVTAEVLYCTIHFTRKNYQA